MKLKLLFLICFFIFSSVDSQNKISTSRTEISVLTIGSGSSLNDAFGHNAFRVNNGLEDVVYDYGRFNFNAPNFYLNFAKGKLDYFMGKSSYYEFKKFYIGQKRSIKEVSLNLNDDQKIKLQNFLEHNLKPENKYYAYDFFYDNCSTKMRDVLIQGMDMKIEFNEPIGFEPTTFRKLIQQNLDWNSWGSMGIDIALGSVIDKTATAYEHMFLPAYIHEFFETATIKGNPRKPLVNESKNIYENQKKMTSNHFYTSPFFIFLLLSVFIIYVTYKDNKNNRRSRWMDICLFSITGTIGVLLLTLWFATDHTATAQNYNLLWAFPLNLFVIRQILNSAPKSWVLRYLKFLIIMLCLLALQWVVGIQGFAFALLPLFLALGIRYAYLIVYYNKLML